MSQVKFPGLPADFKIVQRKCFNPKCTAKFKAGDKSKQKYCSMMCEDQHKPGSARQRSKDRLIIDKW